MLSEKLTFDQLKARNTESDSLGFKSTTFGTTLEVGTYNGNSTGEFKELRYTSKKRNADGSVNSGRINFAICTIEKDNEVIEVDVPVSDTEAKDCSVANAVQFEVFYPENDTTQYKRVKLLLVSAVVTENNAAALEKEYEALQKLLPTQSLADAAATKKRMDEIVASM